MKQERDSGQGAELVDRKITQEMLADGRKLVSVSVRPRIKARPHVEAMLAKAYYVIDESLNAIADKVRQGRRLDREEVNVFAKMAETLSRLTKEEREQEKAADPTALSDEELLARAEEAKRLLKGGE